MTRHPYVASDLTDLIEDWNVEVWYQDEDRAVLSVTDPAFGRWSVNIALIGKSLDNQDETD